MSTEQFDAIWEQGDNSGETLTPEMVKRAAQQLTDKAGTFVHPFVILGPSGNIVAMHWEDTSGDDDVN